MSDTIKNIQNTQINVSATLEDIYVFLAKLMDEKEQFNKDKRFLKTMKGKNKFPVFLSMENVAMKRLIKELDKNGIPYMQFDIYGTSKDVLLFRPEDTQRIRDIENGIRIQAGLEIDTKEELDRALAIMEKDAKEIVIRGLTEYEADRVIGMSRKNPAFTAVAQQQSDETWLVASHEKNSSLMYEYVMNAVAENENGSTHMQNVKKAAEYIHEQKKEFLAAIDEIRDRGLTRDAYLISLTKQDYYIHIKPSEFEIVDREMVTHFMKAKDNPSLYPDVLKFLGEDVDTPLFVTAEELRENGGMRQTVEKAEEKLKDGIKPHAYPEDVAFKEWLSDSLAVSTGKIFEDGQIMNYVHAEDFATEQGLTDDAARMFNDRYEKIKERVQDISVSFEKPQLELEDIMRHEGMDPALSDRLYDEEEIKKIRSGEFQYTAGSITDEEIRLTQEVHAAEGAAVMENPEHTGNGKSTSEISPAETHDKAVPDSISRDGSRLEKQRAFEERIQNKLRGRSVTR